MTLFSTGSMIISLLNSPNSLNPLRGLLIEFGNFPLKSWAICTVWLPKWYPILLTKTISIYLNKKIFTQLKHSMLLFQGDLNLNLFSEMLITRMTIGTNLTILIKSSLDRLFELSIKLPFPTFIILDREEFIFLPTIIPLFATLNRKIQKCLLLILIKFSIPYLSIEGKVKMMINLLLRKLNYLKMWIKRNLLFLIILNPFCLMNHYLIIKLMRELILCGLQNLSIRDLEEPEELLTFH